MKRVYTGRSFRRIFPLFSWVRCDKCNLEFVREFGWKKGSFFCYSLCSTCAPDRAKAQEIYDGLRY